MIEQSIYNALSSILPTYPVRIPEDATIPACCYFVVSDVADNYQNTNQVDSWMVRMQVDIYAKTYKEAKNFKDQVLGELIILGAVDLVAKDMYEDETSLYREMIDFRIRRT